MYFSGQNNEFRRKPKNIFEKHLFQPEFGAHNWVIDFTFASNYAVAILWGSVDPIIIHHMYFEEDESPKRFPSTEVLARRVFVGC